MLVPSSAKQVADRVCTDCFLSSPAPHFLLGGRRRLASPICATLPCITADACMTACRGEHRPQLAPQGGNARRVVVLFWRMVRKRGAQEADVASHTCQRCGLCQLRPILPDDCLPCAAGHWATVAMTARPLRRRLGTT